LKKLQSFNFKTRNESFDCLRKYTEAAFQKIVAASQSGSSGTQTGMIMYAAVPDLKNGSAGSRRKQPASASSFGAAAFVLGQNCERSCERRMAGAAGLEPVLSRDLSSEKITQATGSQQDNLIRVKHHLDGERDVRCASGCFKCFNGLPSRS
jgi:hypothetical protein